MLGRCPDQRNSKHRIDILTGKQTGQWKGRQLRRRHSNFNVNFLYLCIFSLCEDETAVFVINEIKIRPTDKHLIKRKSVAITCLFALHRIQFKGISMLVRTCSAQHYLLVSRIDIEHDHL